MRNTHSTVTHHSTITYERSIFHLSVGSPAVSKVNTHFMNNIISMPQLTAYKEQFTELIAFCCSRRITLSTFQAKQFFLYNSIPRISRFPWNLVADVYADESSRSYLAIRIHECDSEYLHRDGMEYEKFNWYIFSIPFSLIMSESQILLIHWISLNFDVTRQRSHPILSN